MSQDYAVGQIIKKGIDRVKAETWVKRMTEAGLLAKDPEGYLRLVK
jgi:hypothetical protein